MRAKFLRFTALILIAFAAFSCEKTEQISLVQLSDYVPLQPGKYITYRLDSTVFPNFGRNTEIHYYEEKNVVDQQITDNMGRPSYRIYRFLRDTLETRPWVSAGSYFITPTNGSIEVIENNLRFVRLALPIREGFTWKVNHYLPSEPYKDIYTFSNDDGTEDTGMPAWDDTYDNLNDTLITKNYTLDHVLTVNGVNEASNLPIIDQTAYASLNFSQEKYAKGIGMVYQEYTMWEYQSNTGNSSGGYKNGFGVKRTLLDHN
jgi:hypothetical protein